MRALGSVVASGAAALSLLPSFAFSAIVDAGTLTTVSVEAPLYDPDISAATGCPPAGCVGDLTRDGDLVSSDSRWACRPALSATGSTCSISYSLADSLMVTGLNIALYKGDTRTRSVDIYVDGSLSVSWTSSGTTAAFEEVDVGVTGQIIELQAVLADSEWISVMEVEILVDDGEDGDAVEAGTVGTVTTEATLYDPSTATEGGCDPSGCTAALTRDGDLSSTSRWSCAQQLGGQCTISYNLGAARTLSELRLAMYKGTLRTVTAEVYVDDSLIVTWTSSGTTDSYESIDLSGLSGTVITLTGVLAGVSEWFSIVETQIMVFDDGVTSSPSPTPAPQAPSSPPVTVTPSAQPVTVTPSAQPVTVTPSAQPVTVTPSAQPVTPGSSETVGLLPLAGGREGDIDRFYAKDGDLSTAWTCSGDPKDADSTLYDCYISFRLFSHRHIKQVKIALADGAQRASDLRISTNWYPPEFETFVTSSGSTDELETYDFDYFANDITISAVFATEGDTISISEVEFVEEVQADEVYVNYFNTPYDNGDGLWNPTTTDAFEWSSDSDEAIDRTLSFILSEYATVTAVELQFPVGDTYLFDLIFYNEDNGDGFGGITGLESTDATGWQTFEVTLDQYVTSLSITIKGTGSGAPGFAMLDGRIIGTGIDNPTNEYTIGSTYIEEWYSNIYPDFVTQRSSDQMAIMEGICAVKQATFDGVDCVGEVATATGTVSLPMGEWYVDGNIFMKSGVHLDGRYSIDDSPYTTDILLDAGAAGKTSIGPIVVIDGVSDASIEDLWIRGLYDPDVDSTAVDGLGSTCLSVTNSQNITCKDTEIRYCDGDGLVISNSNMINIDAGDYDDEYLPWTIGFSRGTGLLLDTTDAVWVRRHAVYDNGVAGIHIIGSNNFTFEATIGGDNTQGEGYVGNPDGQQPIEVIVESSTMITFQDMRVLSTNDPVMTISGDSSGVVFNNNGFLAVPTGTCVIQTVDPSVVTAVDDELILDGTCYVKV